MLSRHLHRPWSTRVPDGPVTVRTAGVPHVLVEHQPHPCRGGGHRRPVPGHRPYQVGVRGRRRRPKPHERTRHCQHRGTDCGEPREPATRHGEEGLSTARVRALGDDVSVLRRLWRRKIQAVTSSGGPRRATACSSSCSSGRHVARPGQRPGAGSGHGLLGSGAHHAPGTGEQRHETPEPLLAAPEQPRRDQRRDGVPEQHEQPRVRRHRRSARHVLPTMDMPCGAAECNVEQSL